MTASSLDLGYAVWYGFRILFIALLFIYLFSGLDDLFMDLVHYVRLLYRQLFRRKQIRPVTREQLNAIPEKPLAIMIPAWDESSIIQRMLLNTAGAFDYKNFRIFVGTYPNDPATAREVEKAREVFANIEVIVTPGNGPTNKADCLNWIYQGILLYEKEHGVRFEAFVMHDAEDIVHPLWLKFVNLLMPRIDFIQLPVFALETPWHDWVSGVYRDEFAENHTKDMRAREVLSDALPSAGVGTALSRKTLEWMARERKNQIFDITSVTEDYLLGIFLSRMPGKKIFLQQWVEFTQKQNRLFGRGEREVRVRQPVATREFFPSSFTTAARQKSRWILGISLQGWKAGWTRSAGTNYFLYRDRKALFTNLVVVFGYLVVAYWLGVLVYNRWFTEAPIPPLVEPDEIYYNLGVLLLGIFAWRIANRMVATARIYGWMDGLLALPRLFIGNFINFYASVLAIQRFFVSRISGKTPAWGKTAHAWPTEAQMRKYRRKLGDLLIERRMVTEQQLEQALAIQRQQGGKLGEILMGMGLLWEEDLVTAMASQQNEEAVEIDPHANHELLALVPRGVAEQHRIYPLELKHGTLVLARQMGRSGLTIESAHDLLGLPVSFRWTSGADIDFAIHRSYGENAAVPPPMASRLGRRLLQESIITPENLVEALRRQKRSGKRLGEILIEMNVLTQHQLNIFLHELGAK